MGIPSFYRWLVQRYPLVVTDAIEEPSNSVNGVHVYPDSSRPNPNGLEFDNLYLDMNGIIHPCFHPEGLPAPKTYDEVFKAVFGYIDKLFSIVRPRKLLYMAIDGVAPRAKMNQQRTRRFRAAKEAAGEGSGTENGRGIFKSESEKLDSMPLDSNIITPGTKFMALLSTALRYYVHLRMNEDPGWQGVKVIISDSSVPGEGEHKIMSYIRLQRNLPGFDPNTRHCLYGLDADLIMLALATHEIHFSILREEVVHTKKTKTFMNLDDFILRQKFQFLNIWVLRSYLAHELRIPDSTVETDLERLIDDFVFMCLFVGNDFLPHVPSLDIQEGAIDLLMIIYKKEFVHMGGYLTNSSEVNLKRVEHFVQAAGSHENAIFNKRLQVNKKNEAQSRRYVAKVQRRRGSIQGHSSQSTVNESKDSMVPMSDAGKSEIDKVKLGEVGWKERYYTEKFEVKTDDERQRTQRDLVLKYIEGICWVMHYYYQGVCSWQWFYPYHFAPFASDFCGIYQLEIKFTLGEPFKPLDQLMAVLPTASAEALPFLYSKLMTDPSSPILDYYPIDFELDLNGKHLAWQAVCKLPFINESRLLSEIAKVEPMLTDEEKKRNRSGLDMLFLHISHPLAAKILSFLEQNKDNPKLPCAKLKNKIDHEFSGGMNGYICISDKPVNPVEIPSPVDGMETITKNKVISVLYEFPSFHPHIPKPPEGVRMPAEFVNENDLQPPPVMWHIPTLFGHELTQRPIPKLSIIGSELASSTGQLIITYYLGKGETKAGLLGSHTQHMKNKEAQEELVRAIRNLVCRPKKVKDKDSENLIDGALIDGGDGGSEKRVDGGDGGSEKRVDGGDGGSENRFSGGAITTSNKKRKKNCRKSQNGAAHLEVQLAPELPGSGSKNHMDGESKKKKGKMLRKSGDEVVAQEVQKSPNQLPVGNENCIDGESKRINRKRLGNTGDEVVTQEVQNSPKQLHVGNENHIDAESKSLKRRLRNSGDEVVTQEVQNSPKQLPVCNENHIDGESKSLERKRAKRLRQRLQKRLRNSGYEVVTQEVQDSPKQLPVVNENHIDGGSRKRKRKYREMRHKLGKEEVPLGGGQVTQKPVNAGSENQVEDVLLGQEAQKPVNAGSENQTDGRAKESKPMQNFKIKSELLPGLSSSSGSCTGSGPMTRLRYSHLVQIGMMEDK